MKHAEDSGHGGRLWVSAQLAVCVHGIVPAVIGTRRTGDNWRL